MFSGGQGSANCEALRLLMLLYQNQDEPLKLLNMFTGSGVVLPLQTRTPWGCSDPVVQISKFCFHHINFRTFTYFLIHVTRHWLRSVMTGQFILGSGCKSRWTRISRLLFVHQIQEYQEVQDFLKAHNKSTEGSGT